MDVLKSCARAGLNVVALTDHDIPPVLPWGPQSVLSRTIHVIHAVEVSVTHQETEQHVLVYFPKEMPADFAALCTRLSKERAERYEVARSRIGLPGIPEASAAARAGEHSLTRLHLAQALVAAGHAPNLRNAFSRWVGNKADLVPHFSVSFLEILELAKTAGGFTAWAHPSLAHARQWTGTFAKAGLDALEVCRPAFSRSVRNSLDRLAYRHGLQVTGGSDYHGHYGRVLEGFSFSGRRVQPYAARIGL
jgi:hypothetical protein